MTIPTRAMARPTFRIAVLAGLVAVPASRPSPESAVGVADRVVARATGLEDAPPEVREFLGRVLARLPGGGVGVTGYRFCQWREQGRPTRAALGIKAIPGVDPDELIARVMDVDGYEGRIAHVDACRSRPGPAPGPPGAVRFYQRVAVPGVARVQQELVLIDLGTIDGYRVACWYLLGPETGALDPKDGARAASSVGVWLAAPGVVGYALSCWPRREDVNAVQWLSLTAGADALASRVVEGTIDGMAGRSPGRGDSLATGALPGDASPGPVPPGPGRGPARRASAGMLGGAGKIEGRPRGRPAIAAAASGPAPIPARSPDPS